MPTRVMFFRPNLGEGGADRVTITLLEHLDRARFAPSIALVRASGTLLSEVPADVPVIDLAAPRLALAVPALARAIAARDPDVVVCTASGANVFTVAAHRLARSRARLVLSERTAVRRTAGRNALRTIVELGAKRVAYRFADEVTAVSDGVAEELVRELGLQRARIRTVYNPLVDDSHRALAEQPVDHPWFSERERPLLVAVGRLVSYKDYPTMLQAFARIHAATRARLAILGSGPLLRELEAFARELGIADAVAFVGFDPNPFRYLARATLTLQSSQVEGLPGAIVQSMSCGTPVVATDCDHGPREVIRHGVDGFLVPIGSHEALAARAIQLLEDSALRERFSAAAVAATTKFSVASSLQRYEAAIAGDS
jgi:glycosyltransferase involved in cell wall biosynthesis